jgi:hypothetical protein
VFLCIPAYVGNIVCTIRILLCVKNISYVNKIRLLEHPGLYQLATYMLQAPKLIRQLSCDSRIEAEIRNLSLQVTNFVFIIFVRK